MSFETMVKREENNNNNKNRENTENVLSVWVFEFQYSISQLWNGETLMLAHYAHQKYRRKNKVFI